MGFFRLEGCISFILSFRCYGHLENTDEIQPLNPFGSSLTTSIAQADSYPPVEENNWEVSYRHYRCLLAGMRRVHLLCRQLLLPLSSPVGIFEDFALWSVLNLPLAPNKRVTEEGLLVETQTPPTLMLGASYEVFKYEISETFLH